MDFPEIYELHFSKVYNYVRYRVSAAAVADDVVSGVFERVLEKLHTFDPARGTLEMWLYAIARNALNTHFRMLKLRTFLPFDLFPDLTPDESDLSAALVAQNAGRELLAAVARLEERDKEIIAMKFGLGLNNREIATLLDLSESNVGTVLSRAMARLRLDLRGQADG